MEHEYVVPNFCPFYKAASSGSGHLLILLLPWSRNTSWIWSWDKFHLQCRLDTLCSSQLIEKTQPGTVWVGSLDTSPSQPTSQPDHTQHSTVLLVAILQWLKNTCTPNCIENGNSLRPSSSLIYVCRPFTHQNPIKTPSFDLFKPPFTFRSRVETPHLALSAKAIESEFRITQNSDDSRLDALLAHFVGAHGSEHPLLLEEHWMLHLHMCLCFWYVFVQFGQFSCQMFPTCCANCCGSVAIF